MGLGFLPVILISPFSSFSARALQLWGKTVLFIAGARLTVEGREHLKGQRNCVLIANHQSIVDIPLIFALCPFAIRMVARKELAKVPILNIILTCYRFIYIDRSHRKHALASIARAAEIIKKGSSVVLFAEGTRSLNGELSPFQTGSFLLAVQSQSTVIPVTLSGTIMVSRKGSAFSYGMNKEIRVIISPPINTEGMQKQDRYRLKEQVETKIKANYARIKYLSLSV